MEPRQQRGLEIAAKSKIVWRELEKVWVVPSQSNQGTYAVDYEPQKGPDRATCSCPDYELRKQPCKHVFAVEIVVKREEAADGSVTETRSVRMTYAQNWPAYNAAQTTEKEHFCRLLSDLVSSVPSPEQKMGRPRLPLSDMIFAAAFKVYSTVSGRRFSVDLKEAAAKGLISRAPHYNSVFNVIESEDVTPILHELIERSSLPLREVETDFAIDSTGFGTSQFFRYYSYKYKREETGRGWVKTHAMVGTKTNVVTAISISERYGHDAPELPSLVEKTAENFEVREVSADKAYSSKKIHALLDSMGTTAFIPFKSNSGHSLGAPAWNKAFHYFALHREDFLARYHKRSNVESTFSAIKRVFGDRVRSKTPIAQRNEVLLKVLCHNIRCLIHAMHEHGIKLAF